MEDFELLCLLKKQKPELAEKLINKLFQACDQYDKDIRDYRKVKQEVLGALTGSTI